jgi:hypothetical protein
MPQRFTCRRSEYRIRCVEVIRQVTMQVRIYQRTISDNICAKFFNQMNRQAKLALGSDSPSVEIQAITIGWNP